LLIGIELGSVGGEGLDPQPREAVEHGADERATVDLDAVPEDELGAQPTRRATSFNDRPFFNHPRARRRRASSTAAPPFGRTRYLSA
jgi:hypothetical protein